MTDLGADQPAVRAPIVMGWAAAGLCVGVLALSACASSSGSSKLPAYTGGASASTVTATGAVPTATSSSETTPSPAKTSQMFTIKRGALPAGLSGDGMGVADAWLAYWDYLAVADSIPAIDPATVGSVMTGAAAAKAQAYVATLQREKTHVVGTVGVDTTSVRVHGATATLCGKLRMNAFEFTAAGKPAESVIPTVLFFKGTAEKSGPKWRISDYVNLAKSC